MNKKKKPKYVTQKQLNQKVKKPEIKQATTELTYTTFNSAINSTAEFYSVLPGIGNGVGSNQRIGDQIWPKRIEIRGYINYNTNSYAEAALIIAHHFCFQPKNIRYQPQTATTAGIDLLTNGGSPSNFTGALLDITRPHNNEEYTFFSDKRHTFCKPFGQTNTSSPTYMTDITYRLSLFLT